MKFNVRTEGLEAIKEKIAQGCTKAERIVAVQVKKDTSPFVPMLTTSLDLRTRVEGSNVIYPGPYARFLYYGKVMIDPHTGSTYAPYGGMKVVTDRDLVYTKSENPQAQSHWFEASKAQNKEKWMRVAEKAVKNGLKK